MHTLNHFYMKKYIEPIDTCAQLVAVEVFKEHYTLTL